MEVYMKMSQQFPLVYIINIYKETKDLQKSVTFTGTAISVVTK